MTVLAEQSARQNSAYRSGCLQDKTNPYFKTSAAKPRAISQSPQRFSVVLSAGRGSSVSDPPGPGSVRIAGTVDLNSLQGFRDPVKILRGEFDICSSEVGNPVTFMYTVPYTVYPMDEAGTKEQNYCSPARNPAHVKSILIVDDNPLVRAKLRLCLERQSDWRVCGEAVDGRDAIEQALILFPDLIVLDLAMPCMNGFEVATRLRKLMPSVRLALWTAYDLGLVEKEARACGFDIVGCKSTELARFVGDIETLFAA